MTQAIKNKTILVTGGTGSFGMTMVGHLLREGCAEIRVFSRDEWKQEEMRLRFAAPNLRFHIGDVRSRESIDAAMEGVDLVFHAAALKQVPSCEFFPMQAVLTNITGSSNVIESAIAHDVECLVCLSTDKAVHPVNTMGMTKAIMEKVAQAAARRLRSTETRICTVRYGNVMYSRGSVIPLFVRQINEGRQITVTDPQMARFMLPLADAVHLVQYAFQYAEQGDTIVKKAPACTIATLLQALQDLFQASVPMHRIGMRHGEKRHEVLASAEELRRAEIRDDFFQIRMDNRELDYSKFLVEGDTEIDSVQDYSTEFIRLLDVEETKRLLLCLPEIRHELTSVGKLPKGLVESSASPNGQSVAQTKSRPAEQGLGSR